MTCYILYSPTLDSYYVGITTSAIEVRLSQHNESSYGKKYTSKAKDWEIYFEIKCDCSAQGVNLERHIKRMKSRTYLENLKKYPELSEKLKLKYPCN